MKKFEVGKIYKITSVVNHECVWSFKILKRTEKTVTIEESFEGVKTCRISKNISEYNNAETIYPFGKYSMCPVLSAD